MTEVIDWAGPIPRCATHRSKWCADKLVAIGRREDKVIPPPLRATDMQVPLASGSMFGVDTVPLCRVRLEVDREAHGFIAISADVGSSAGPTTLNYAPTWESIRRRDIAEALVPYLAIWDSENSCGCGRGLTDKRSFHEAACVAAYRIFDSRWGQDTCPVCSPPEPEAERIPSPPRERLLIPRDEQRDVTRVDDLIPDGPANTSRRRDLGAGKTRGADLTSRRLAPDPF